MTEFGTRGDIPRFWAILLILCISFAVSADSDLLELLQQDRYKDAKALGVILKFKRWSSEAEEKLIRKKLKSHGLVSGKKNEDPKMWVFHWSENASKNISKTKIKDLVLKPQTEAKQICLEVEKLSIKLLEYCEPNSLLEIDRKVSDYGSPKPCGGVPKVDSNLNGLLSYVPKSVLARKKCPPLFNTLSNDNMKGLSKYWAQEMIGSDLLRKELAAVKPPESMSLAVFDIPEDNHDIEVTNLITDDGAHAVLPELSEGRLFQKKTQFSSDFVDAAEELKDNKPSFINNSMGWDDKTILEAFESLVPPSLLIMSAGNRFPMSTHYRKEKASQKFDAILVGSFSPQGIISEFSSPGKEVHIHAPSDYHITSANKDGSYVKSGGTSGAAPLVTGSLAAFHWLSGYHPTGSEAKMLLEKTAIPTIHSRERPRLNGVGMLNTYKLGMVGKRIGKKCAGKEKLCFSREINNNENYVFEPDISKEKLLALAGSFFPACADNKSKRRRNWARIDCGERKEMLTRVRRAALLNPDQGDLWNFIACIYEEEGLSRNAFGLRMIALAGSSDSDNGEIITELKSISYSDDSGKLKESRIARWLYGLGDKKTALKIFNEVVKKGDEKARVSVALSTINMEDSDSIPIIKKLAEYEKDVNPKWVRQQLKHKGVSLDE